MNETQAKEEIQLIKNMLERTRKATAESGTLFIVWGVLITLALSGNLLLAHFKKYDWIWVNWVAITVIGWVYSVVYGIRRERKEPILTYAQVVARHLYFSCGTTYLLIGIVFPALKVYSYPAIPVLHAAVSGILFIVMSGIYEWLLLKWMGFLWLLSAVLMSFFVKGTNRLLIFTILFIGAFLIPSFILKAKYKRELAAK